MLEDRNNSMIFLWEIYISIFMQISSIYCFSPPTWPPCTHSIALKWVCNRTNQNEFHTFIFLHSLFSLTVDFQMICNIIHKACCQEIYPFNIFGPETHSTRYEHAETYEYKTNKMPDYNYQIIHNKELF